MLLCSDSTGAKWHQCSTRGASEWPVVCWQLGLAGPLLISSPSAAVLPGQRGVSPLFPHPATRREHSRLTAAREPPETCVQGTQVHVPTFTCDSHVINCYGRTCGLIVKLACWAEGHVTIWSHSQALACMRTREWSYSVIVIWWHLWSCGICASLDWRILHVLQVFV